MTNDTLPLLANIYYTHLLPEFHHQVTQGLSRPLVCSVQVKGLLETALGLDLVSLYLAVKPPQVLKRFTAVGIQFGRLRQEQEVKINHKLQNMALNIPYK